VSAQRINSHNQINIQEIVQAVVAVVAGDGGPPTIFRRHKRLPAASGNTGSTVEVNTEAINWQQLKFATKLIPTFSGRDKENILKWLERIMCAARMYRLTDEVIVLTAISQLRNRAQKWYNRQPMDSVATWEDFKFHIRRHFEVKESYTATLAKIGQRTWNMFKEKFVDYAEEKLSLMQNLSLTEKEKIELLTDGIKDPIIRKLVLSTWVTNVPDFIDHVRRITEDSALSRRSGPNTRFGEHSRFQNKNATSTQGTSDKACFNCKQTGHLAKDCKVKKPTCFKCGEEGHISPTRKRQRTRERVISSRARIRRQRPAKHLP